MDWEKNVDGWMKGRKKEMKRGRKEGRMDGSKPRDENLSEYPLVLV